MTGTPGKRVAMISGGNRGIGLALAKEFARAGYFVSAGVRQPDSFPGAEFDPAAHSVHAYDASDRHAPQRWTAETLERWGRVDALVVNAGIGRPVTLTSGSEEDLDEIFEVNAKGPYRLVRAALPHLRRSGEGRVAILASLAGKRVLGPNVGYQMTKHAAVALAHAVRREGWDDGVRATAVCPGLVNTDLVSSVKEVAKQDMIDPADLAHLVATTMALPNNASVAELLVNCRYEAAL